MKVEKTRTVSWLPRRGVVTQMRWLGKGVSGKTRHATETTGRPLSALGKNNCCSTMMKKRNEERVK